MSAQENPSQRPKGHTGAGIQLVDRDIASQLMASSGIDLLLPHTQINAGYLADYYCNIIRNWPFYVSETQVPYTFFVGLPADGNLEPFVLSHTGANAVDIGYHDPWIYDRYLFGPSEPREIRVDPAGSRHKVSDSAEEAAVKAIRDRGLETGTIGVEARYIGWSLANRLQELLPEAVFVDSIPLLNELRRVKSQEEVRRLEAACSVARAAHEAVGERAELGMTGRDVEQIVKSVIVEKGCDVDFVEVHANQEGALLFTPNDFELKRGEPFAVDIGARYMNYVSDMAHNYCFGEPDQSTASLHAAGRAAFDAVVEEAKPGRNTADLYEVGRQALADRGYEPTYRIMGHGLGRDVHELPVLAPAFSTTLEPGEVIAVEVPLYAVGASWVQIEENFLVEAEGLRWFSPWDTKIRVL